MAEIHDGVQTSTQQRAQKMAKFQNGMKPDIFKYAPKSTFFPEERGSDLKVVNC